jgi:hypothetical protein
VLAHLAVERGPRTGSTFVVGPGVAFVVGSDPTAQARLEGLQPKHAAFVLEEVERIVEAARPHDPLVLRWVRCSPARAMPSPRP